MRYLITILLGASISCNAQKNSVDIFPEDQGEIKKVENTTYNENMSRYNNLKINLYGVLVNSYSVFYERKIRKKFSAQIGYRYQPYGYVFDNIVGRIVEKHGSPNFSYYNFKTGNYAITADIRYYMGRHETKGFFIGLYGRYTYFDIDNVEYTYVSKKDESIFQIPLVSNLAGEGGGITFGRKWLIKKTISLEVYSGVHYLVLHGPLTSNKDLSRLSSDEQIELQKKVEDLFTFFDKKYITTTVNDKGISGKITGPPLGLKTGLSLGFVF